MPPMYGWWDSFPGRPEGRSRWLHHLDLYLPMVRDGSRAWLEIGDNTLFISRLPQDVTASLFANEETYLVLANYSGYAVEINGVWTWKDRESGRTGRLLSLPPHSLCYFVRVTTGQETLDLQCTDAGRKVAGTISRLSLNHPDLEQRAEIPVEAELVAV